MTEHGQALAMQLALTRLQKRHEVPTDLFVIPLSEAVDHDLVVEGFASTTDIDLARNWFSKHAFTIPEQPVPLLYKHDPPRSPAPFNPFPVTAIATSRFVPPSPMNWPSEFRPSASVPT